MMKYSDSTEMDRLLRRYSRRNGEALPGQSGQSDRAQEASAGAHMDADELNAYAEGALPEAARSRYFAHLADCDTCRKLVTELTLASGVVSEEKRVAVVAPTPSRSWREWLAALLSPPVLRYAVPALALFGVIIVAFVMMRARREAEFVSENNQITNNSALKTTGNSNTVGETPTASSPADTTNHTSANIASSNNIPPAQSQQPQPETAATPMPAEKVATTEENRPAASSTDAPKPVVAQTGINDKKQGTFAEEGKSGEAIAGATTMPQPSTVPAAPPSPPGADDARNKREEQEKTKSPKKDVDEMAVVTDNSDASATVSKTASNEARRDRGRRAAETATPNTATRMAAPPKSEATDAVAEKERPTETRSVSGRRFRREGNAWVDTAYNSSRSTINVARGSEQYRALVADEPGLRTITQQLGGEVIVVWKSRAYRFY